MHSAVPARRQLIAPVLLLTVTASLLTPITVQAKDRELNPITKYLKTQFQARQKHGFWLGLAGMAVKLIRPAGVKSIKISYFEDLNLTGGAPQSAAGLGVVVRNALSYEWQPLIRVASNQKSEKQGFIYAKRSGKDIKLMIVALDNRQAFIARVKINPEAMMKFMEKPEILGIDLSNGRDNQQNQHEATKNNRPDNADNKDVKLEKQEGSQQP